MIPRVFQAHLVRYDKPAAATGRRRMWNFNSISSAMRACVFVLVSEPRGKATTATTTTTEATEVARVCVLMKENEKLIGGSDYTRVPRAAADPRRMRDPLLWRPPLAAVYIG